MSLVLRVSVVFCCLGFPSNVLSKEPNFAFRDGDRIVLLGNTLIEREQLYGYWETLLTLRTPGLSLQFRNLGWSGDTVFADSRAGFGTPADGFRALVEQVRGLQPTVLIFGYGGNEAHERAAGLPRFRQGFRKLIDSVRRSDCRLVFLLPPTHARPDLRLPDPAQINAQIRLYQQAIRELAREVDGLCIDLQEPELTWFSLTDNGVHLTAYGYYRTAAALAKGLGLAPSNSILKLDIEGKTGHLNLPLNLEAWPRSDLGPNLPAGGLLGLEGSIVITGLPPGKYALFEQDQKLTSVTASRSATLVRISPGHEYDLVERLRRRIVEKNRLYFHRYRPQNDVYLFGFRKHEQGQNAREIPQFDPLIENLESEIQRIKAQANRQRTYRLLVDSE